jgi:small subunit ribosomal protein S11
MSKTATKRFLAPLSSLPKSYLGHRLLFQCLRSREFSQTSKQTEAEKGPADDLPSLSSIIGSITPNGGRKQSGPATIGSAKPRNPLSDLSGLLIQNQTARSEGSSFPSLDTGVVKTSESRYDEPHHLHIYSHRHNTHITLTRPDRKPLISMSTGNIGFKKAGRKTYDAAFQLASYVMGRIQEQGLNMEINNLELTLRGFGLGREAVTKALLGSEGQFLRGKVVKISDATRLKFGGTRSKKPRRLG